MIDSTVHVTHFVNPHCFYFKFDSDLHDDELQILEEEISRTAHSLVKSTETIERSKGDVVAAYVTQWNKWVRAQICDDLTDFGKYKLWAYDHGRIFETNYKNVVSLPTEIIDQKIKRIRRGSVYGISPAKLDLNIVTLRPELTPCENWSPKSIQHCIHVLNHKNVRKLNFEIKEERDDYFFGNLVWEVYDKKTKQVRQSNICDLLRNMREAVNVNFIEDIYRITSIYATDIENLTYAESIESVDTSFCEKSVVSYAPSEISLSSRTPSRAPVSVAASDISLFDNQSIASSSIAPSEIDDGTTRMNLRQKMKNPVPKGGFSSVAPSEINGGMTRMNLGQKFKKQTPNNDTSSIVSSAVAPSEINGGMTRMNLSQKFRNPISNDVTSIVSSSVAPSEINGGMTRMNLGKKFGKPPPNIEPTEINGGVIQLNQPLQNRLNVKANANNSNQQNNRNNTAYMPAGHERGIPDFNKFNRM